MSHFTGNRGIHPLWGVLAGFLIGLPFFALPLWASVSYRLAVGGLHEDLSNIEIASAEVIDHYVSSCFEDIAPASVQIFQAPNSVDLHAAYVAELESRGFTSGVLGTERVWSRERGDSLDGDIVRLRVDERTNTLTVIGDAYDIDMVACLPLTGRS